MEDDVALVERIRTGLASAGDAERAVGQQAYMKSSLPFYGLTSPELRRIIDPLARQHAPPTTDLGGRCPGTLGRRHAPGGGHTPGGTAAP